MDQRRKATCKDQIIETQMLNDLYKACYENDVEFVRLLLETTPFETINCTEFNVSTALEIATNCDHVEIIHLLHEYNALRHLTENQDRTDFETTQAEEIEQLFRQPVSNENRFCTKTRISTMFSPLQKDTNSQIPYGYIEGMENFTTIRKYYAEEVYPHCDSLIHRISDKIPWSPFSNATRLKHSKILFEFIEEHINSKDLYIKAKMLVKRFSENGSIEELLRLYTLETPFYRCINQNKESSEILASPIYHHLRFLRKRVFKGTCYRGLSMTNEDIGVYQWAEQHTNRYIVTNTFCSSTTDENVANGFAKANTYDKHKPVLMIFTFHQSAFTAIQLGEISDKLPCISENKDEQEILILPRTVFTVTKVEPDSFLTKIYLEYFDLHGEVDMFLTYWADAAFNY
ncbi:hypothetical protein I4U23_023107 [Adineta vaga]|nr:hypothetical protein I4U23_023107 [Adineta vaga]